MENDFVRLFNRGAIFAAAALAFATAIAEVRPFSLYQPIIDRCPFGQPPPGFDPTIDPSSKAAMASGAAGAEVPLTEQQEQLKKTVNATALIIDATRSIWVGFTDTTDSKAPRNYYLQVGSSEGGWLVKSADPETKVVTLAKDDVEIELTVGAGEKAGEKAGAANAASNAGSNPLMPLRRGGLLTRADGAGGADGAAAPASLSSMRQRRRLLEEEARRREAETRKEEAEAERKRLREEFERIREQARQEREAERAAEQEESKKRMDSMAADLAKRLEENQNARADGEAKEESNE